jgi:hypothetical protein
MTRRRCLDCGNVTTNGTRCETCHTELRRARERGRHRPPRIRPHYAGDYQRRARFVRQNATVCWICLQGPRPNDPWTADHLTPGDPKSVLLPAHRSCNSRRQDKPVPATVHQRPEQRACQSCGAPPGQWCRRHKDTTPGPTLICLDR